MKELYQNIYDKLDWYGNSHTNNCPGVRFIPYYEHHLMSPILDLGCGRGHTVQKLREKWFNAFGMDFIELNNDMFVGDITQELDMTQYNTSLCIDVFEHLTDEQVRGVLENMSKTARQVISVTNNSSIHLGKELHINIKSFESWYSFINEYLNIKTTVPIKEYTMLFLCERRL